MQLIRPIALSDLEALESFAQTSMGGLTSLPKDRALLEEKIERSLFSFTKHSFRPSDESYLFILEDDGTPIGCSGVRAQAGGFDPLYAFEIGTVRKGIRTLSLRKIHNGPTEIGSLFLLPEKRKEGLGPLLSLSRFLFISLFPDHFEERVMASLRGVINEDGSSPFWDTVCRPFFGMELLDAMDRRIDDPRFIDHLVPQHPLYINLLPPTAAKVLGKAHPNTRPALKMLQEEGFSTNHLIDIFDAGPFISAPTNKIRTINERKDVQIGEVVDTLDTPSYLCSNQRLDFRACLSPLLIDASGKVTLPKQTATALQVEPGETISYVQVGR